VTARYLFAISMIVLLSGKSAAAQDAGSVFKLTVCNKTGTQVSVIFFYADRLNRDNWMLDGWYAVKGTNCRIFESLPRGYFYWFAKQDGGEGLVWQGTKRNLCTSIRATWRKVFPNEQCLSGETNRGFSELLAQSPSESINLAGR